MFLEFRRMTCIPNCTLICLPYILDSASSPTIYIDPGHGDFNGDLCLAFLRFPLLCVTIWARQYFDRSFLACTQTKLVLSCLCSSCPGSAHLFWLFNCAFAFVDPVHTPAFTVWNVGTLMNIAKPVGLLACLQGSGPWCGGVWPAWAHGWGLRRSCMSRLLLESSWWASGYSWRRSLGRINVQTIQMVLQTSHGVHCFRHTRRDPVRDYCADVLGNV